MAFCVAQVRCFVRAVLCTDCALAQSNSSLTEIWSSDLVSNAVQDVCGLQKLRPLVACSVAGTVLRHVSRRSAIHDAEPTHAQQCMRTASNAACGARRRKGSGQPHTTQQLGAAQRCGSAVQAPARGTYKDARCQFCQGWMFAGPWLPQSWPTRASAVSPHDRQCCQHPSS